MTGKLDRLLTGKWTDDGISSCCQGTSGKDAQKSVGSGYAVDLGHGRCACGEPVSSLFIDGRRADTNMKDREVNVNVT